MSNWKVIIPEKAINFCRNSSYEIDTSGVLADGTNFTISQTRNESKFGAASLDVSVKAGSATGSGSAYVDLYRSVETRQGEEWTFSFWYKIPSANVGTYNAVVTGATLVAAFSTLTKDGEWHKATVTTTTNFAGTLLSGTLFIRVYLSAGTLTKKEHIYIDGVDYVQSDHDSDHIDGDQPGCVWNGTPHNSTSTRNDHEASGGKIVDLLDDLDFKTTSMAGFGIPGVQNNSFSQALKDGELFDNQKINSRQFSLIGSFLGANTANYHALRQKLLKAFNVRTGRIDQPQEMRTLRYTGAGVEKEIQAVYQQGLSGAVSTFTEKDIPLTFSAKEPFFKQIGDTGSNIENVDPVVLRYVAGKRNGLWRTLIPPSWALDFDSSVGTEKVNFGSGAALDNMPQSANGFTFEGWFAVRSNGGNIRASFYDKIYTVLILAGDEIRALSPAATTNADTQTTGVDIIDRKWHHIAITYKDTGDRKYRVFVDGVEPNYGLQQAAVGALTSDAAASLFYGNDSGGNFPFDGQIGWTRFSNTILYTENFTPPSRYYGPKITATTIAQWNIKEQQGTTLDDEVGANNGTITGASWEDVFSGSLVGLSDIEDAESRYSYVAPASFTAIYKVITDNQYLYVAGNFTDWDGITAADHIVRMDLDTGIWSALGSGMNGAVYDMDISSDGRLWVVGDFTTAGGGAAARIAVWNGTSWAALGAGIDASGRAIKIIGNTLYVGGLFANAGGLARAFIARYTISSATWGAAMGTGLNSPCYDLDADSNGLLYIAGQFTTANGATANRSATWNGTAYAALGSGLNNISWTVSVDLNTDHAYYGGDFTTADGATATRFAKWNKSQWLAQGDGFDASVRTIDVDSNGIVYIGGLFTFSGSTVTQYLAMWNGSRTTPIDMRTGTSNVGSIFVPKDDDGGRNLFIGFNGAGIKAFHGVTYINYEGTADAYPVFVIKRSGGTSCKFQGLTNPITNAKVYFDYDLEDGEQLTLSFQPDNVKVISSYHGEVQGWLSNSDVAQFFLVPSNDENPRENIITCFTVQSGNPTVTSYMYWKNTYFSLD